MFRYRDETHSAPFEAGTFNHRAEALYRAATEFPENEMVQQVLNKGLVKVKMMILSICFKSNLYCFILSECH